MFAFLPSDAKRIYNACIPKKWATFKSPYFMLQLINGNPDELSAVPIVWHFIIGNRFVSLLLYILAIWLPETVTVYMQIEPPQNDV
jgi:hypothetical protein